MEEWELIIYMPAFNSEKILPELFRRFRETEKNLVSMNSKIKILLIINDGSTDRTAELVRGAMEEIRYLKLLNKQKNEGPIPTLLDGMKEVAGLIDNPKKTIVIRMDSDLEHQPEDIEKMIKHIISRKTKISVGYIPFDSRSGNSLKKFNETVGLEESRRFLGVDIPQFCPGFLAIRGDLFLEIHPLILEKAEKFKKRSGEELLSLDFIILVISKKLGQIPNVIKLSPIEDVYIKKQSVDKIKYYLVYHFKTVEFLKKEL